MPLHTPSIRHPPKGGRIRGVCNKTSLRSEASNPGKVVRRGKNHQPKIIEKGMNRETQNQKMEPSDPDQRNRGGGHYGVEINSPVLRSCMHGRARSVSARMYRSPLSAVSVSAEQESGDTEKYRTDQKSDGANHGLQSASKKVTVHTVAFSPGIDFVA